MLKPPLFSSSSPSHTEMDEGRLYVGNLADDTRERDLEDEFNRFGRIRDVWVARNPAGFAFVTFDDGRDAEVSVKI